MSLMKFGKPKTNHGKKSAEWNNARERLKKLFQSKQLTSCEICDESWEHANLSFAHSKKRRHIEGNELFEVILCCIHPCHDKLERLPEYEMTEKVREIIQRRGWDAKEILK